MVKLEVHESESLMSFTVTQQATQPSGVLEFESEANIILHCARTNVDAVGLRAAFADLDRPLNWNYISKIAGRNGLMPLVSSNLLRFVPDLVDEDVRSSFSGYLNVHTRNNILQTYKVVEISEILRAEGVPVLPFKGPTLAIQAYGDISLRQYVDLDILMQPRHFDNAVRVLRSFGYKPIERVTRLKRKGRFFTRKKDLGLVSENGQVRIELHWKLSGTHFAMPIKVSQLWNRLETIEIGGARAASLPFSDLFVYLCLHGSRHGWEKFLWICDLNELIRETEKSGVKIDWPDVMQHAGRLGCKKVLRLGLFLINWFFGRRVDHPDFDEILLDPAYSMIAEDICKHTFAVDGTAMQIGERQAYHLLLKERVADRFHIRLIYLLGHLRTALKPNDADEAAFSLPPYLHPLYYLLRPVRLILAKCGRSSV